MKKNHFLVFYFNYIKDDPSGTKKVEDAIIAWTFKLYREKTAQYPNTYQNLPLLFPMTKVN